MLKLTLLKDPEYITAYIKRDHIYKQLLDVDNLSHFIPDFFRTAWIQLELGRVKIGVFVIQELNAHCIIFHGGVFKEYRHKESDQYLKDCLSQLRKFFPKSSFITTVPETNIVAQKLVEKAGMIKKCNLPSACKSGNLIIYSES